MPWSWSGYVYAVHVRKIKIGQNNSRKAWRGKSPGRSRRTRESYIKAHLKDKGHSFIWLRIGFRLLQIWK
jgi:hypothetical protein